MFKGILISDAYGAGFEFENSMLKYNDGKQFYNHPTHMASDGSGNSLKAGMYTDDTQMSIAVAETLIGGDLSREAFANKFVECFKRDPRKGYAKGFYNFLLEQSSGETFLRNIRPDSDKNGAAMRSVPLGVIKNISILQNVCTLQASITHNTKIGIDSSIVVALMANYFYYNRGPKDELLDYLKSYYPEYPFEREWTKPVPCHGIATALAVFTAIMSTDSLQETMIKAVSFGGDTDSVASIACGIQQCYINSIDDFNVNLINTCEQGSYGLNYCFMLEDKLFEKFEN